MSQPHEQPTGEPYIPDTVAGIQALHEAANVVNGAAESVNMDGPGGDAEVSHVFEQADQALTSPDAVQGVMKDASDRIGELTSAVDTSRGAFDALKRVRGAAMKQRYADARVANAGGTTGRPFASKLGAAKRFSTPGRITAQPDDSPES